MAEAGPGLSLYSIAAHRGFADALVAGLIPRYRDGQAGLSRLTLLLPSRRAVRTVTEAFVRLSGDDSGGGLLLPRMATVGDLDIDETLGALFDPIGTDEAAPPAADPTRRWLALAEYLAEAMAVEGLAELPRSALLRQSRQIAQAMDRMLVEGIGPQELFEERVIDIAGNLSGHWIQNLRLFAAVQARWQLDLADRGEVDAPTRRNRLLARAAANWRAEPPESPIVAAGVTSASPAIADLLRVVAGLPRGAVILPDLDLALDEDVWNALGRAGRGENPDDTPIGVADAVTHPQYHLKLLLNRMGVARDEFRPWHRAGRSPSPPARSRAISNLFLPPAQSASWVDLEARDRRLDGVRLMTTDTPEEEAQAIALLLREALDVPERRAALVTPDRALAGRVIAHLRRWGVTTDDTAGTPLSQTPAGRIALLLAEVLAERAAPAPLAALIAHPLAGSEDRQAWLRSARRFDRGLRGPRLAAGLEPLAQLVEKLARKRDDAAILQWWQQLSAILEPLVALGDADRIDLDEAIDALAVAAEALCGIAVWSDAPGRSLAAFVEDLRENARAVPSSMKPAELPAILREAMDAVAVRPPYGGHSRVAVYGLIEARMSRADLVVCGGLTEGVWPAHASGDPLLAPPVLRALGVPGGDFRIGLAAHDLAAALGAPEVVLSHAHRDAEGAVVPSRFVLRVQAMLGEKLLEEHREREAVDLARAIDRVATVPPHPQPDPKPSADQRLRAISATAIDQLRSDPYQYYAKHILRLTALEAIDEAPTPAWRGSAVHEILHRWYEKTGAAPGELVPLAQEVLAELTNHPFMRGLWQPRLVAGLEWVDDETQRLRAEGRTIALAERSGSAVIDGVTIKAKADRIDVSEDGSLAIVDYKTGAPRSAAMVEKGFALQLGTTGVIAARGGFEGIVGEPDAFEYWSLAKGKNDFGYRVEPVLEGKKKSGIPREDFLPVTEDFLHDAIARWIKGDEGFTARPHPDLPSYTDYDQLMRLDEWLARGAQDDDA